MMVHVYSHAGVCTHICVAVNIQQEVDGGPSVTGGQA